MIPYLEIFVTGLSIIILIFGFIVGMIASFIGFIIAIDSQETSRERMKGLFLFMFGMILLSFYVGFGVYYGVIG